MASCSRKGGQAPGQLAHWNGFPDAPWRGDYHTNINVQENYWPIYTANHPELGWPFYDLYKGILDFMIADTRRYTGMPGARFVRGHGRSGRPYGRGADWEMWPGGSAWLSAHFWWHYQFTRDEAFLRDTYPLMRASLDYFVACVGEPDEEGVYNIIPSVAHEQSVRPPVVGAAGPWGRNSSYELGLFRELLMHTIRASEILDVDEEERAKWRDILDNLAAYPVSPDGWFEEWEGISLWESHRHLSPLYPVYPGEEIHQDVDEGAVRVGRQSVLRFLARGSDGYTGFSFGWMAACAARMGMADEALSMIRQHLRAFVNVNGYSLLGPSMFPGLAPYSGERGDINAKLPNCESGGCFCAAINELLLRSPQRQRGRPSRHPRLPGHRRQVEARAYLPPASPRRLRDHGGTPRRPHGLRHRRERGRGRVPHRPPVAGRNGRRVLQRRSGPVRNPGGAPHLSDGAGEVLCHSPRRSAPV